MFQRGHVGYVIAFMCVPGSWSEQCPDSNLLEYELRKSARCEIDVFACLCPIMSIRPILMLANAHPMSMCPSLLVNSFVTWSGPKALLAGDATAARFYDLTLDPPLQWEFPLDGVEVRLRRTATCTQGGPHTWSGPAAPTGIPHLVGRGLEPRVGFVRPRQPQRRFASERCGRAGFACALCRACTAQGTRHPAPGTRPCPCHTRSPRRRLPSAPRCHGWRSAQPATWSPR